MLEFRIFMNNSLLPYVLQLGDNALILGQRLGEWCGHGPILEQDIAMTNIALDLMGQARSWMDYAAQLAGPDKDEDQMAFLRQEHEYRNLLLVEQPNEDFAHTIVRQFLFDSFNYYLHEALQNSNDETIKAIAAKSLKEITYHLRYSSEWMIRLGDGTDISHQKMQTALDTLWSFSGEALVSNHIDQAAAQASIGPDLNTLKPLVEAKRKDIIDQATLTIPENDWMQAGGKTGRHTESMGYILADMQYMQRAYPGQKW